MRRELKIGIFLAGTFLIVAVFIFIVGDLSTWFQKSGYELSVFFPSSTGLERRAAVRLAGVKIGYVRDIRLAQRKAQVVMSISPQYQVPKGSTASLSSLGLVGERYIEIAPSDQLDFLKPGESIEASVSVGFDQLGNMASSLGDELKEVARSIRTMTGEESQKNLAAILQNMNSLTQKLDKFMADNSADLQTGVRSASQAAREFEQTAGEVSRNLNETSQLLKGIAQENRENIKSSLEKIQDLLSGVEESLRLLRNSLEKINKGEGTIGKLVQDPALYEDAQKTLGTVRKTVEPLSQMRAVGSFRGDYLGETEKVKTYLSAGFYLNPHSFLLGQIVEDPRLDKFTYSAQAGVRFGALAPRAGIIESEFGAGVDYLTLGDRLMFSLESFDFQRGGGPRFRFTTQYALLRYLHLVLGVDDFSLDEKREVYFGIGLGTR
jgi:phospholipid/cholesterol/gamma-HCH transport system substrate-binding protein